MNKHDDEEANKRMERITREGLVHMNQYVGDQSTVNKQTSRTGTNKKKMKQFEIPSCTFK
jgi:hypothetical protein